MADFTSPIRNQQAGISGLRITKGEHSHIEFQLSFPLNKDTEQWMTYLARCCRFGQAFVDIISNAPSLDDELEAHDLAEAAREDDAQKANEDPFPGWPKACGKKVRRHGAQSKCTAGHITSTTIGEPCNWTEPGAMVDDRCPILWGGDTTNRCELNEAHPGAHRYPRPPLDQHPALDPKADDNTAGGDDPEHLAF